MWWNDRVKMSSGEGSPQVGPTAEARPGSQASLRSANERRIVEALRDGGELTQAQLSRRTGLAAATVSNIVHALREIGLVTVTDTEHHGRRGRGVRLSDSTGYVVGMDFGHRHLSVALANLAQEVVGEHTRRLKAGHRHEDGLRLAAELVDMLLDEAGASRSEVVGAGMTLPAPMDSRSHEVGAPSVLPGWVGVNAPEVASEQLGFEVHVDNDANLAALAEHLWGAGRSAENLVYLMLGEGIGAGLILEGRLFRGGSGAAGEIGHITIDELGRVCRCGNRGCLETIVSTTQVLALLAPTHGADLTVADVVSAARRGDAGSRRVLADTGRTIGVAVANLCNILNPELVLVGGELADAGDLMLEPMREIVSRYGVPGAVRDLEIRLAELGARSAVLGAVAIALHHADLGRVTTAL
jgi:predicted NBD/HSP70 family sugar kinase